MGDGAVVAILFISISALIFGIVYYYLQTRHKERMSLIENGADAKLFRTEPRKGNYFFAMMVGIVFISLALGIGFGALMDEYRVFGYHTDEAVYFVSIFFFIGAGFIASFFLHRKMISQEG